MCHLGSCSVSWCVTQYTPSHKQLDSADVRCRLSLVCLWLLLDYQCWILSGLLLLPSVMGLLKLCFSKAGPFVCSSSSQMGRANSEPWVLARMAVELLSHPALLHPRRQGQLSSTAGQLTNAAAGKGVAGYPALTSLRPARPCPCHQGQLYCAAQVRCRAPLSFSGLVI